MCFVSFQPGHPRTEEVEPPFQELEFKALPEPTHTWSGFRLSRDSNSGLAGHAVMTFINKAEREPLRSAQGLQRCGEILLPAPLLQVLTCDSKLTVALSP